MFFAIIPTVIYEVLGAQAALLTDCSLAAYGRSGTAARPKWPLGLGSAAEVASWQAPQLGPCASSGPALAGSGLLRLALGRRWLSQGSVRHTVRPAVAASKADVTACGHPTSYCDPTMTYCYPTYDRPGKSAIEAQCVRSAGDAFGAHRKMLVLNLLMFAWDIAKYLGNSKEADGSKAEGAKQKAS